MSDTGTDWETNGWRAALQKGIWGCPAAKRTNCILWCIKQGIASQSKEVILPPLLVLVRAHLEHCVLFWSSQHYVAWKHTEEGNKSNKSFRRRPMRRNWGHLCYIFWRKEGWEVTSLLPTTPDEGKCRGRCWSLLPINQWWDAWEWHKTLPGELQIGY